MAIVKVPHLGRTLIMPLEIEVFLAGIGVDYQRWTRLHPIPAQLPAEELLGAYQPELQRYLQRNNFASCRVMELAPEACGLGDIFGIFNKEHWHGGVESRFVLSGRGFCYVHPFGQPVGTIELEPGDLISVGKGICHWFNFCAEPRFRAIEFISRTKNESTVYTRSGIESEYEPLYISPSCTAG